MIVLVVIGLIGWCVYRFCKKKRPKGAEDKTAKEDDENALVDNEEANIEDVSSFFCNLGLDLKIDIQKTIKFLILSGRLTSQMIYIFEIKLSFYLSKIKLD